MYLYRKWLIIVVMMLWVALAGSGHSQHDQETQTEQKPTEAQTEGPQENFDGSSIPNEPVKPIPIMGHSETGLIGDTLQGTPEHSTERKRDATKTQDWKIDDLAAQQGMNEAAQRMADYSKWSLGLIAIGTLALIWTLVLTKRATKSAQDVVEVTREIGQKQVKAYLTVDDSCWGSNSNQFRVKIKLKNYGQSPCISGSIGSNVRILKDDKFFDLGVKKTNFQTIPANDDSTISLDWNHAKFTDDWFEFVKSGGVKIILNVGLSWEDVFGNITEIEALLHPRILDSLSDSEFIRFFYNRGRVGDESQQQHDD